MFRFGDGVRLQQLAGLILFVLAVLIMVAPARAQEVVPYEPPPVNSAVEAALLTQLLLVVARVALPIILTWALKEFHEWQLAAREDQAWLDFEGFVRRAVLSAEQLGATGELKKYADDKLEYAILTSEAWLEQRGLPIDLRLIRAEIEAQVRTLNKIEKIA